jgi:hypothetical protein
MSGMDGDAAEGATNIALVGRRNNSLSWVAGFSYWVPLRQLFCRFPLDSH